MAGEEEEEEAPRVIALLDSRWFGRGPDPVEPVVEPAGPAEPARRERRSRRRREKCRSLTELQGEEVKGLRDLGFVFAEDGLDPGLLELVPGLRRLEGGPVEGSVARPYLSEAWPRSAVEERRRLALQRRLREWKVPSPDTGVDMKLHLRLWAHSVAASVQ